MSFIKDLTTLLNRYSKENDSGTPDFILAEYIDSCLNAYNKAIANKNKHEGNLNEFHPHIFED